VVVVHMCTVMVVAVCVHMSLGTPQTLPCSLRMPVVSSPQVLFPAPGLPRVPGSQPIGMILGALGVFGCAMFG